MSDCWHHCDCCYSHSQCQCFYSFVFHVFSSCTCLPWNFKENNKVRIMPCRFLLITLLFPIKKLLHRAKSFWIMVQPITRDPELKNPRTNSRQVSWLTDQHIKSRLPGSPVAAHPRMTLHSLFTVTRSYRTYTCFPFNLWFLIKIICTCCFIIQFLTEYHYFFNFTIVPVIFLSISPTEAAGIKTKQRK